MQHAQMILSKKREQKTKLELTGRLDKVGAVTNEVSEVKYIKNLIKIHKPIILHLYIFSGKPNYLGVKMNLIKFPKRSK